MRTDDDREWHAAYGISISRLILRVSDKSGWFINSTAAWLSPLCTLAAHVAMWWQFTRWYLLVCPLCLSFHPLTCCFILSLSCFSAHSIGYVPSVLRADELNRVAESGPYGATVWYSDAEESTFGFKSSSQGSYTALILLSMYPCKVLCMPVTVCASL